MDVRRARVTPSRPVSEGRGAANPIADTAFGRLVPSCGESFVECQESNSSQAVCMFCRIAWRRWVAALGQQAASLDRDVAVPLLSRDQFRPLGAWQGPGQSAGFHVAML